MKLQELFNLYKTNLPEIQPKRINTKKIINKSSSYKRIINLK